MSNAAGALLPVGTLILGYVGTMFTESRRDARQERREAAARANDRRDKAVARRESFELDHLLKLNDALQDLGRAMGRFHHLDSMIAKTSGAYGSHVVADDAADQALLTANRSVRSLRGLVLDEGLRDLVRLAQEACNQPSGLRNATQAEADALLADAIDALDRAQDAIAARVRQIYSDGTSDSV